MNRFSLTFLCLFSAFVFHSCEKTPAPRPVVVIGADGFSAEVVKKNPGAFPNIEALMKDGSYSYEVRSVLPSSSAPNWKSILTGTGTEIHGHTTWGSASPEIPPRLQNEQGQIPGIFTCIRQQHPQAVTGFFYNWETLGSLFDKGMESKEVQGKDEEIETAFKEFISQANPDLAFLVFGQPDGTGHGSGWESPEYIEACKVVDKSVGEIVKTVKASPRGSDTVIFFIADHGGKGKNHGGKALEEMRPIFVMEGAGIKKNHNLQSSIMVYDIPATIADLEQVKLSQPAIGRSIREAFEEK